MSNNMLVLIDIQNEYITAGRPFFLNGIAKSLANGGVLLSFARQAGWDIVHVRHEQPGAIFAPGSEYADFIEGFGPLEHEAVFVKHDLSCYANDDFATLMARSQDKKIFIAGYGSTMCCLSTIVAAYHNKQRVSFVADASLARSGEHRNEQEMHEAAVEILGIYADIVYTDSIVTH